MLTTYLLNLVGCALLYFFTSHALMVLYPVRGTQRELARQVFVSLRAIPVYALLPNCVHLVAPYTKLYGSILQRGFLSYLLDTLLFLVCVEVLVYWVHRALHTKRFARLHRLHHSFKDQLSPFAGLAFHPLDGIAQALPYAILCFALPIHAPTHKLLMFATGIWTSFIHSGDPKVYKLLLGPRHHKVHHTCFCYNFGHYTVLMDKLCSTYKEPEILLQNSKGH